jgi:hypothetical protein
LADCKIEVSKNDCPELLKGFIMSVERFETKAPESEKIIKSIGEKLDELKFAAIARLANLKKNEAIQQLVSIIDEEEYRFSAKNQSFLIDSIKSTGRKAIPYLQFIKNGNRLGDLINRINNAKY